jgi:predicted Zn-dependent peptidase
MKIILILFLTLSLMISGCSEHQATTETQQLKNGLSIILRPIKGAKSIALVVLYNIGEQHDPPGQSGMGHLIEHLYVTAATAQRPSRNVQQFTALYPDGWNAQTGNDYTIIATLFPVQQLKSELQDAAARMNDLKVEQNDLTREIPRMDLELSNMYGNITALATPNLASAMVIPHQSGSRKGGTIEQISRITIKELKQRMQKFYKPQNATIILAGDFDPAKIKPLISQIFSPVTAGEIIYAPPKFSRPQPSQSVKIQTPATFRQPSYAAIAFRAPSPSNKLFPAFLVLTAKLQLKTADLNPPKGVSPVIFSPLDRPEVLIIKLPAKMFEKGEEVIKQLKNFVKKTVSEPLSNRDITKAQQLFGFAYKLQDYPDTILANNPYGVAFALGRCRQLKIDSTKLCNAINRVTEEKLHKAAHIYLNPEKCASGIVEIK